MSPNIEWPKRPSRRAPVARRFVHIDGRVVLHGRLDEEFCFAWLKSIPGVELLCLRETRIDLAVDEDVSVGSLRDLIAWAVRYRIGLASLRPLAAGPHELWMKKPGAYWFDAMFPRAAPAPRQIRGDGLVSALARRRAST